MTPELAETRGSVVEKLRSCRLEGQGPQQSAAPAVVSPQLKLRPALCWGSNGDGELGNGTNTSSNVQVAVGGP